MTYSSLHNHSEYSVLDGFAHPEEYLNKAQELGLKAFAITEHGNEYSWVYFDKIKDKYPNIKIIYGVELYECFDINVQDKNNKYFHLIALAKNEKGRIALNHIVTKSNFEGFYYKPRVDLNMLKPYADDLIITSACLASKLSREENYYQCVKYVQEYKEIFPYFYLEMQSHNTQEQEEYNKKILQLAEETNTSFIITTDSHAATKEDLYYQNRLVQIAHDTDTMTEAYDGCYLQSEDEIHSIMDKQIGTVSVTTGLENTNHISDMIDDISMPFQPPVLPTYPLPEGYSSNQEYLYKLVKDGWYKRRIDKMPEEEKNVRKKRLAYELEVIHNMGFDGYFLIVWDFINYAKNNNIMVGAGRGCFTPDTRVLLESGKCKTIDSINIGEKIVTHKGNIKPVLNKFEYNCNEYIYEINYGETNTVKCTGNHEILAKPNSICYKYELTKNPNKRSNMRKYCSNSCRHFKECEHKKINNIQWIEAKDLKIGDYVCFPKVEKTNNERIVYDLANCIKNIDKDSIKFDDNYVWMKNPLTNNKSKIKINRYIEVNEEFCELAGWYISQGWNRFLDTNDKRSSYSIGFAHHSDKSKLIGRNVSLLYKIFGIKPSITKHKSKNVVQIHCYSKIISAFFEQLFGKYAINKQIPQDWLYLDTILQERLIKGLWDGDGTYKLYNYTKTKYSSINANLVKQIQFILNRLNIPSTTHYVKRKKDNWHDEQYVSVSGCKHINILNNICDNNFVLDDKFDKVFSRSHIINYSDGKYTYFRIKDIQKKQYKGKVYDLHIKDDVSYITESMAVHNSAGGSLVVYLLGIAELDPITYDLIFERFLNPERVGMPDIDCDFADRKKIITYLTDKYGEDKVCQIINYSYITPTVAIKDVGRVLGIPYAVCDKISKRFTMDNFEDCIKNNPNIYQEYPEYKELFDIAGKLSGRVRNTSTHAGGIGIVDTDINDYMAMKLGSENEHVIQVDKKMVEAIGIVKFDILGVKTLKTVQEVMQKVGLTDWDLNINNPDFYNDKAMYELLCSAKTCGVFQTESAGMRDLLLRLQPNCLEDVSAVLALYRPDSMSMLEDYIYYKHNPTQIKYWHPDIEYILKPTYGSMIYQEQMMEVVRKLGGLSYGESDVFRKAISKKIIELVKQESAKLYDRIIKNGYDKELAKKVSNHLSEFGGYMFNKSHSALYSILTLVTAYLKAHYPAYFFAALLNSKKNDYGAINKYIIDAKDFGIEILPPNINQSDKDFTVVNNKILFGLEAIKDIGEKFVDTILQERNNGKFKNLTDFKDRVKPSDKQVITLIKAGAIPCKNKASYLLKYAESLFPNKEYQEVKTLPKLSILKDKYNIDTDIFKDKEERLRLYNSAKKDEFEKNKRIKFAKYMEDFKNKELVDEELWEFNALSVFITDNPFEKIYDYISVPYDQVSDGGEGITAGVISKIHKKKDRNGKQFAFITIYSVFGLLEFICWHTQYKQYQDIIKRGSKVAIKYNKKNDKGTIVEMKLYDQWLKDRGVI